VVKKTYTNPARQIVTLTTDGPFFRPGTVARAGAQIRFFDAATNGNEITFNGTDNVFSGAQLSAGVQLFAEGATPSVALDDVVLTLTLTPGATPIGPPATATMTSVELTLDVALSRVAPGVDPPLMPEPPAVAPPAGTATDKFFLGRFVQVRDPKFSHERAMLIIQPPNPTVFTGSLVLTPIGAAVEAFNEEIPAGGQLVVTPPPFVIPGPVPVAGVRVFAQGTGVSNAARDTGFRLGIQGVEAEGDIVAMTAVQIDVIDTAASVAATTFVRMGLWDNAFRLPTDPLGLLINNEAEADNFVGADTRRFHVRVRDVSKRNAGRVQIDWFTLNAAGNNLDAPVTRDITLVETPANSGVFISRGLMLVTDSDDQNQATRTGLPAGFPDAGTTPGNGARNHRIRRGSMLGRNVLEYAPAAAMRLPQRLNVFQRNPESRRRLPLQIFVMKVAAGGNGVIPTVPAALLWTRDLPIIRETYERIGMTVETVVHPNTIAADIVRVGADSIVLVEPTGVTPGNMSDAEEQTLSAAHPALADTIRVFYAGGLATGNRGESAPDINFAGRPDVGTSFINGSTYGPYSVPHEVGHVLTNKPFAQSTGHFTAPAAPPGNRLRNDQNLMRNGTSTVTGVTESKRLWDAADNDGVNEFTTMRGSHYTRPF
jgi:hypothetical protein